MALLWGSGASSSTPLLLLSALNLLGWSVVSAAIIIRRHLIRTLGERAGRLGVSSMDKSLLGLYELISKEQVRKSQALSMDLIENRISSSEELSRALEKIVGRTFKLLEAESAELVLFDQDSGGYHSSFVLGRPMNQNQAELTRTSLLDTGLTRSHPGLAMQPISFGGTVLGSLCVELKQGRLPSQTDKELLKVLALQGTLAIVNSRYNEELLRMKRSSEESVRAKTGFLANLSHELRGPLGIIINAVEVVLEGLCGPVSQDQADTLKMVRQNGQHLLELINDVLDYAKTESGTIAPERVQVVVDDLLIDVTNVVRSQAQQKNHTLVCRPADAPLTILCDRRHIRQMMINLLTNAVKYTPPGGRIEVWAERTPGSRVKILVKDSGIGIEPSQHHRVFAPFERADNAYTIKQVGTGLGMPLTRKLAELNGGICSFDSTAGKGSTFWLIFPAIEYATQPPQDLLPRSLAPQAHGERLLLIDRSDSERPLLAKYLEHVGFVVDQAAEPKDALPRLAHNDYKLVLLGNDLADDSDERFIAELRALPSSGSLPVMVLSSRAFAFDVEKYLKLGIDRCLTKPLELQEIASAILDVMRSHGPSTSPKSEPLTGANQPPGGSHKPKSDDLLH